jgi:hypothetical protein
MLVSDMLVDATTIHAILPFIDDNFGYNQLVMAKEDIHVTTLRCLGPLGIYEWIVMSFELIN